MRLERALFENEKKPKRTLSTSPGRRRRSSVAAIGVKAIDGAPTATTVRRVADVSSAFTPHNGADVAPTCSPAATSPAAAPASDAPAANEELSAGAPASGAAPASAEGGSPAASAINGGATPADGAALPGNGAPLVTVPTTSTAATPTPESRSDAKTPVGHRRKSTVSPTKAGKPASPAVVKSTSSKPATPDKGATGAADKAATAATGAADKAAGGAATASAAVGVSATASMTTTATPAAPSRQSSYRQTKSGGDKKKKDKVEAPVEVDPFVALPLFIARLPLTVRVDKKIDSETVKDKSGKDFKLATGSLVRVLEEFDIVEGVTTK